MFEISGKRRFSRLARTLSVRHFRYERGTDTPVIIRTCYVYDAFQKKKTPRARTEIVAYAVTSARITSDFQRPA